MRASIALALFVLTFPPGIQAQIPPRRALASASGALRVVVPTPVTEETVDRSAAIDLAQGFRERLAQHLAGKFQIVSRDALNKVLASSGYEADAPLGEAAVRALGTQLQAAFVFAGSLRHGADGKLTVSASLASPSESAPHRVSLTQAEGQDVTAFGAALAEQLKTEIH
jgi:TolB-like protein